MQTGQQVKKELTGPDNWGGGREHRTIQIFARDNLLSCTIYIRWSQKNPALIHFSYPTRRFVCVDMIGDEARITAPHITGPSSILELKSFSDISPPLCELRAVPLFPTSGTPRGGLTEIPLLRSPKGTAFSYGELLQGGYLQDGE